MTMISLAAIFHAWGKPQFDKVDRGVSVTRARELVNGCLAEMYAEIDRELDRQDAATPERQQIEAAMAALECSFGGVLAAVRVVRPRQHPQQDPYGHGHQGPGQDPYRDQERRQQQQQPEGGGPLSFLGAFGFGRPSQPERPPPRRPSPGPQDQTVVVMSQTLYDQLFSVCEAVDRILEAAEPPPEAEEVPWARTSDFLKEAHPLLTAYVTGNGERALEQIELLEERLRTRYGIEVKLADEETASLFTVYPNSDPLDGSYETRIPALLVDGKVWQKGEALGPVTEQYAPQTERGQSHRTED